MQMLFQEKQKKLQKTTLLILLIGVLILAAMQTNDAIIGKASYYANKFHGRKTASGEIYDKTKFTAAHKNLPFGTKIKVTNLSNNKTIVVRINDRGPFVKNRIIDVSYAAAKKIDMIKEGVIKIKIVVEN